MSNNNEAIQINVVNMRTIIKIIRKRLGVIISGIFGMVIFAAVLSFYILDPVYEARALLRVAYPVQVNDLQSIDMQGLESTVNSLSSLPKMTMQTHVSQLRSEAVAERVIKKLELHKLDLHGKNLFDLYEVSVIKDTNLILLTARHNNPVLARDIVNTLSREYIQFISETNEEQMQQTIIFLEKQYTLSEGKLNEAISKWSNLQSRDSSSLTSLEQAEKSHWELEIVRLRKLMELLAQGIAETHIKGGIDFGQASILVVSAADVPIKPVKPQKGLNMIIAFFLGIIIFVPLVFLLEYLDYRIKTPEDVEKYLNLPVLGIIPQNSSKMRNDSLNSSIVTYGHLKSLAVESYRTLQTNLNFSILGGPCRSILFTSTVQNAGKSTILSNLAVVLAQAGHRVLIVDCDLRKPSQHKIFRIDNSKGLLNVLLQKASVAESIHKTVEGPWVLTSGPIPPNPLEIISSTQIKNFWAEQVKEYDYVLVDAPPVLPVADAVVLSTQLDGVILIFDSNATPVDAATEVKTRLARVNGKIIGTVLNRVKIKDREYYYHYDIQDPSKY